MTGGRERDSERSCYSSSWWCSPLVDFNWICSRKFTLSSCSSFKANLFVDCFKWARKSISSSFGFCNFCILQDNTRWEKANDSTVSSYFCEVFETFFNVGLMNFPLASFTLIVNSLIWTNQRSNGSDWERRRTLLRNLVYEFSFPYRNKIRWFRRIVCEVLWPWRQDELRSTNLNQRALPSDVLRCICDEQRNVLPRRFSDYPWPFSWSEAKRSPLRRTKTTTDRYELEVFASFPVLRRIVSSSRPHHELPDVFVLDRLSCVPSSPLRLMDVPKQTAIPFRVVQINHWNYLVNHCYSLLRLVSVVAAAAAATVDGGGSAMTRK